MSTWVVMPSDDDIIHGHKYIDKIMGPNGKWRYIYYRAKRKVNRFIGTEQKNRLERAKVDSENARNNQKAARNNMNNFVRAEINDNRYGYKMNDLEKEQMESIREERKKNINDADKLVNEKNKKQEAAQNAYNKTLLGKIDQVKDAGLKAWNDFTSLFKKESKPLTATNWSKGNRNPGSQYTPSYSTKKSPTTSTRGTAYSPSYKKGPTTSSRGTAYTPPNTQPRSNVKTSSATSFMRNNSNKASSNKGGLVSSSKQNPGVAIGADVINKDKKKKRRRA